MSISTVNVGSAVVTALGDAGTDFLIGAAEHAGVGGDRHVDERFWDRPMCSASAMVSAAQASIAPSIMLLSSFSLAAVPERPDVEQFFFRSAEHEAHP